MSRCRIKFKLNPPGEFEDHAAEVAATFQRVFGPEAIRDIDVVYAYGPAGEVSFTVDALDAETNAAIVTIGEQLRTGPTRAELVATEVWLTPAERDAVPRDEATLKAYDAVYQHESSDE